MKQKNSNMDTPSIQQSCRAALLTFRRPIIKTFLFCWIGALATVLHAQPYTVEQREALYGPEVLLRDNDANTTAAVLPQAGFNCCSATLCGSSSHAAACRREMTNFRHVSASFGVGCPSDDLDIS